MKFFCPSEKGRFHKGSHCPGLEAPQVVKNTQCDLWITDIFCAPGPCTSLHWSEVKSLSRVRLFVTPWTVAYQAPLSMGFSSQEYWSGLPFPSLGDLPNPGIEPRSPALLIDVWATREGHYSYQKPGQAFQLMFSWPLRPLNAVILGSWP